MIHAAMTTMGSGWAALLFEPVTGRLAVAQIHDHESNTFQGSIPLMVLDAWEHAYYLQYEHRRPDYVEAIWNVVDWDDVARRFERARGLVLVEG
jgi:Fe-Mn family superoxide dismutase